MPSVSGRVWKKPTMNPMVQEAVAGYLFVLPTVLSFLIFLAIPLVTGLGLAFVSWDFFSTPRFVGLNNFVALSRDRIFATTIRNTAVFAFSATALNVGLGMTIAIGINGIKRSWARSLLRSAYFVPFVVSGVVTALLFQFLLQESLGVVNYYLVRLGFGRVPWLTSSRWAMRSIIMLDVWRAVGFYVLIFLAGLQGIPAELYEAAEVDGAKRWAKVTRITLPLLTPTLFFSLIIALIGSFQVFDAVYVMTDGGPGDATRTIVMYLYRQAFGSYNMGYAAAIALVLFIIILFFTVVQFKMGDKWVFYR